MRIKSIARRAAAIAALAVIATGVTATASHAAVAHEQTYSAASRGLGITVKPGPILAGKYHFADEHLGLLTVGGKPGICYDYGEASPDGSWTSGAIADVKPGKIRDRMQWTANAHWAEAQRSDKAAAAYKSVLNRLRSAEFRSDWAKSYVGQLKHSGNASVVALSDAWLRDAAQHAGPAKISLTYSKPAPGGIGTAVATVTQAGHVLSGATVKWSITGAAVTTAGKVTAKSGTAKARFTRGSGPVGIRASATVPEWREAGYTVPTSSAKQHLIRGGFSATVSTSGRFDSRLAITTNSKCEQFCDGTSQITITGKATASPAQWQAISGGKVLATLALDAGKSGSKVFAGHDGQTIGFRYRVQVGGKWTAWRSVKGLTVVCPAWPKVTMTKSCPCKGTPKVNYVFTAPGGIRLYDVTLNGQTRRISGTESVALSAPLKSGATVNASFTAYDKASKKVGSGVLDAWTQN